MPFSEDASQISPETKLNIPDSRTLLTGQPTFRPFNPEELHRVYVRNLPHWRQSGATYFVTFRLDDSIPAKTLAEWLDIRERWYRAHKLSLQLKDSDPDGFAAVYRRIPEGVRRGFEREQARMLHEELDRCCGSCLLRFAETRKIVADSLSYFHGERLWLGDAVVMPNHVHALIVPFEGWELEELLGSIKKWASREIGNWLLTQPQGVQPPGPLHRKLRVWQHESYDRIVRDPIELGNFRYYIAQNPEVANLKADEATYLAAAWLDAFAPRNRPAA